MKLRFHLHEGFEKNPNLSYDYETNERAMAQRDKHVEIFYSRNMHS